jgi:uncharacterized protein (TIGR00162 family)
MEKSVIYYNKKIKPKDPIMVVGLPGIGTVGSLAGEHIRSELDGIKFATLYSPSFPHNVIMMNNGLARMISNRFYYIKKQGKMKNDLIVLTGDFQAITTEGQYEVNEKIVRFFKHLGGKMIYTIGGYNTSQSYIQNPKVFGVATNKKIVKELSTKKIIFGQAQGMIMGSAGLILLMARKHKIDAACIMGETGFLEVDANSTKAVIEVLKNILSLDLDLTNIQKIKEETDKMLKSMEESAKSGSENKSFKDNPSYIR